MCRVLERWGSLPEALGLLWPQPLLVAPPCQCLLHFLAAETNVNTANSFTFYILSAKDDLFQSLTFIWIVLQDLYFSKKEKIPILKKTGVSIFAGAGLSIGLPHPSIRLGESLFAHRGCLGVLISLRTCSSSGPHRGFMNFLHLLFPGHGLQLSWYEGVRAFLRPRHSSAHLTLFSFGVRLFFLATFPSYFQPSNLCCFLKNPPWARG